MKITVKDAFGTIRGTAWVEWEKADYSQTGADGPKDAADEARMVMLPWQAMRLETRNSNVPWQLEIEVS